MPKKVFWPVALLVMGLIFLASNMGMLPARFWNLWPLILIVVGLGGLLTADRDQWLYEPRKKNRRSSKRKKKTSRKRKTSRKKK